MDQVDLDSRVTKLLDHCRGKATEVYIEYTEIYKMDIFIIHYLPERHENTPYRHEWANRRSLYIELNCSSTIYSGEKLG